MNLNYKQLAFILDIDPIDALKKIIFVHCKLNNLQIPRNSQLIRDYIYKGSPYPSELELCQLSEHLKLPQLPYAVDQIKNRYLTNQGTKKYILYSFPEKELRTKLKTQIKIPVVLASLLKEEDVKFIQSEWNKNYGI